MTKMLIDRQVVEHALHVAMVAEHPVKLIAALRAALAEPETCTWQQDGDSDSVVYGTSCGHYFDITDGTPEDNKMKWCCYCGKKLAQALIAEPVQEPVLQALYEADRVMGHDDESTEWRERWAHLFSCALTNGGYQCSCGASQKVHRPAPPQRSAEPVQEPQGCDHCNHPLYAATKCRVCGRVTEPTPLQRKPLAEWQINDLMADIDPEDRDSWSFRQGVYAAEKHHGVRK